jgi:hypothetical protein
MMMNVQQNNSTSASRLREKETSRAADVRALSSGTMSNAQLVRQNAMFFGIARASRVNLRSDRALI